MFHVSHKFVDSLGYACSLKNETAIEIATMEISKSIDEQFGKENPDYLIPSEEDSVSSHR